MVHDEAEALARHLKAIVSFVDLDADQVTERLIEAVLEWGRGNGWRVYRKARSVVPIPFGDRHSTVDVGIAKPGAPIVVEVDHSDRQRTLDKLAAEARAVRVALWVRWGTGEFATPPDPVRLVAFPVMLRKGAHGRRLFCTLDHELRPPQHSAVDLSEAEQAGFFP